MVIKINFISNYKKIIIISIIFCLIQLANPLAKYFTNLENPIVAKEHNYSNESNIQLSENGELFEWDFSVIDPTLCYSSSLVFDGVGTPYVSYIDINNKALKLAHWTGSTWNIEIVDTFNKVSNPNPVSLAFNTEGNPTIAYYDLDDYYLKFAYWNGTEWIIEFIDYVGTTYNNYYSYRISLVFDEIGNPAIAYYNGGTSCDLKFAHFDGINWNIEIVYDDGLTAGWGRCASLAFDDWGHPGIAFKYMNSGQPYNQWGLGYAHWNGNIWNIMVPDWGFGTGAHCSLKYNTLGNPAIAYHWNGVFNGPSSARFASLNDTFWNIEILQDPGGYPNLNFNTNGNPGILYCNGTPEYITMRYAIFKDNYWHYETIEPSLYESDVSFAFDILENPSISFNNVSNGYLTYGYKKALSINATIDIDPDTLNLKSNGKWITAYIELPNDFDVNDIIVSSIILLIKNCTFTVDPEAPFTIGDNDYDTIPDLMVKFDRSEIIAYLKVMDYETGEGNNNLIEFKVSGNVDSFSFIGSDYVRIIKPGK